MGYSESDQDSSDVGEEMKEHERIRINQERQSIPRISRGEENIDRHEVHETYGVREHAPFLMTYKRSDL